MPGPRDESLYGAGYEDGLEPLAPLDPGQVTSVDDLVRAMARTRPMYFWRSLTEIAPRASSKLNA